jgi:hypothetical protein
MKIQPESYNSVTIILDDGTKFNIHHAIHGEHDCLFISSSISDHKGKLYHPDFKLFTMQGKTLDWEEIASLNMLKIEGSNKP